MSELKGAKDNLNTKAQKVKRLVSSSYQPLFFKIIHTMTGAPNNAVTALIGSVPCMLGSWEIISHTSMVIAPHNKEAGKTVR